MAQYHLFAINNNLTILGFLQQNPNTRVGDEIDSITAQESDSMKLRWKAQTPPDPIPLSVNDNEIGLYLGNYYDSRLTGNNVPAPEMPAGSILFAHLRAGNVENLTGQSLFQLLQDFSDDPNEFPSSSYDFVPILMNDTNEPHRVCVIKTWPYLLSDMNNIVTSPDGEPHHFVDGFKPIRQCSLIPKQPPEQAYEQSFPELP